MYNKATLMKWNNYKKLIIKIINISFMYLVICSNVSFLFLFRSEGKLFMLLTICVYTNCQHMTDPQVGIAGSQNTHERERNGKVRGEGGRARIEKGCNECTILLRDVNLCLFVRALRRSVRRDTKVRKLLANK